jgi:hypothetical protein
MTRPATRPRLRPFYGMMQVTRVEEWFVEAENEDQARALLQNGGGHRVQVGECIHFEIEKLVD